VSTAENHPGGVFESVLGVERLRWTAFVLVALVLILSSPFAGHSASPVVITSWNGIGPPEADILSAFTQEFNAANPGKYRVNETLMKWDTLYTKILTDFRAGDPPDVMTFEPVALPEYVSLGVLQDLDALIPRVGIQKSEFLARAWEDTMYQGKQYAVPIDMHPWGLFYNRKLFQAAGLPDRGPKTMDEFLAFAKKLTIPKNAGGVGQWGFAFNYNGAIPHRLLMSLLAQKGKSILTPDFKHAYLDNADARQALQFLYDLVYKYKVAPERETDAVGDFKRGVVGMIVTGPWELPDFQHVAGLDFMTAPFPTFYDKPAVWGDSHALVLPRTNSPERTEAAMQFAAFVSRKGLEWTVKAGHIPVRLNVLNSPQFRSMKEWQPFVQSTKFMVPYPLILQYSRVFGQNPSSPLVKMTEAVLLNRASVADATKQAQVEFDQLLAEK
jgi:multiple sugar transport system substrate-binding protein